MEKEGRKVGLVRIGRMMSIRKKRRKRSSKTIRRERRTRVRRRKMMRRRKIEKCRGEMEWPSLPVMIKRN